VVGGRRGRGASRRGWRSSAGSCQFADRHRPESSTTGRPTAPGRCTPPRPRRRTRSRSGGAPGVAGGRSPCPEYGRRVEAIEVTRQDGVVTITLSRPQRKNAINGAMWNELLATFQEISQSASDRVVVLTGAGGDFCSGADLSGDEAGERPHQLTVMRHVGDVALALHRPPQPTLAQGRRGAVRARC